MRLFSRGNLLYALFLLGFLLVLLELGGRWYLSSVLQKSSQRKFQFDPYRIYAHVPGFQESDDQGPRLTINAQGFRRTSDLAVPKPEGTLRIFLLGGSAAHGISSARPFPIVHVRDNETVDAWLEPLLQQRFPAHRVEVVNAAVTGYRVFQHTAYFLAELVHYQPDLLLFMDGFNDHYRYNPDEDQYRDNIYQFWTPRLQQPSLGGLFDHFTLWASSFSGFARGYHAWASNRDAEQRQRVFTNATRGWDDDRIRAAYRATSRDQYLRAIANNLVLARHHGVDAVVALQPGLIFRDTTLMAPVERDVLLPLLTDRHRLVLQPLVLRDLDSLTTLLRTPFIDMNPAFNSLDLAGEQLFLDYCHLSPRGAEVAARTLLPLVEAALNRRLAPAPNDQPEN
jgi:lysophospholipase L1-like esterase